MLMKYSKFALPGLLLFSLPVFAQIEDIHHPIRSFKPVSQAGVAPEATAPPSGAITPAQMQTIYGFNLVSNQGAGQTIGLIDWYDQPNIEADLGVFDTQYGLPTCTTANGCFKKVYSNGKKPISNGSSGLEISLDVEWAHAIAPQAKILLVEAPNSLTNSLLTAIDVAVQNGATVVSMSFGGSESSSELTWDTHFKAAGVVFLASSGDGGHGASWPAISPYVISVGGTTLTHNGGTYVSEAAWSGSGGGLSKYETEPSYQSAFQNQGQRGVPDVAFDADPNSGVPVYDSLRYQGQSGWYQVGGTSLSSPSFAGLIAIVNSSRALAGKGVLAFPASVYSSPGAYHDIATGTNGTCGSLCTAVPGYDFVTGLGTPEAQSLIPALVALP